MEKAYYLNQLIKRREFRFDRLELKGIDNAPVKRMFGSEMTEQEASLFHCDVACGDEYFEILQNFIYEGMVKKESAPVVRIADGEYAFYAYSLECNGLYQQAESVQAIKDIMPTHIKALRILSRIGKLAPLIFPGNVQHKRKSFFKKSNVNDTALRFIDFLFNNKIELTRSNYIPFYVVYAYLTSDRFCKMMDGKSLCIIGSEYHKDFCRKWFRRCSSHPNIHFTKIPEHFVATQWPSIKERILKQIPPDLDLCLVGAGIGSLLVCVDVAYEFSVPAVDAGHVLNMMNGREEKSEGARLYTIRETRQSNSLKLERNAHERSFEKVSKEI